MNKKDEAVYDVGDLIQGDINQWKDGYYKLLNSSVKLITAPETGALSWEDDDREIYKDHKGHYITKKDWERKYPNCDWCSSPLDAEENNVFSEGGSAVCPHCAKDNEVKLFLRS